MPTLASRKLRLADRSCVLIHARPTPTLTSMARVREGRCHAPVASETDGQREEHPNVRLTEPHL